jgi:hypothetical protein
VECQYKGVTIVGLVGLIYGFDEVRARWRRQLIEKGAIKETGEGWMYFREDGELVKYLGKKAW